jgi:hypothetical protein
MKRQRFYETIGFFAVKIVQAVLALFAMYAMAVVTLAM